LNAIDAICFQKVLKETTTPVYWFTNIYIENLEYLVQHLNLNGIGSRRYFYPLHKQPCYSFMELYDNPLSMNEYLHDFSLPSSYGIAELELSHIVKVIKQFYKK
jgi:perosamine synthetase